MSSECRVVSRKADGGGSRGRVEETRCSELRRLSGRDARRVRIRLRGRTQARPLANKSRRADWRDHQPAFACCLWQLFPAAGGGLGRCLSEGQVFRSRGLDCTVHYQFTCCFGEMQLLLWTAALLNC